MRVIMFGVLAWLACGPGLAVAATVPLPRPRPLPAEAPEPAEPSGTATPSAPAAPAGPSQCFAALTSGLAEAEALPPIPATAGCGADDVVRLDAVILKDARHAEFKPPPTLRCSMATAVANWLREDAATQVLPLGAPLAGIENYDSYECRPRNRVAGAEISEHGRANAIDIRSFTLTNGKRYELTDPNVTKSVRDNLKATACARFTTVLGPGSDGYHEEHIHLDLAERSNGFKLCHWEVNLPVPLPRPRPAGAPPRADAD